eukprot:TRINITY_DN10568_c0_g1_i1.p1 TRINITY_DN10568_c0_g1~~TRINITY_DN10568_c0_g1_i1.p1  ORF type:complete len:584 (-),score=189.50 TRINITY_DN10568_c0_g1_i1:20-1771(-)
MNNPLQLGLEYVKKAIQYDQENKLQDAVENYTSCLIYFQQALKDTSLQNNWSIIQQKILEYQSRKEVIEQELKLTQLQIKKEEPTKDLSSQSFLPPKKEEPINLDVKLSLNDILEKALNLLDRAKLEQSKNNKEAALDLFTDALDNFMVLYKNETDPTLKKDIENYLMDYTTKAEKLKEEIKNDKNKAQQTITITLPNQYPLTGNQPPYNNQFTVPTSQYPLSNNQYTFNSQYPYNNPYPVSNNSYQQSPPPVTKVSPRSFSTTNNQVIPIVTSDNPKFNEYIKKEESKKDKSFETTSKKDFLPRKGELTMTIKVDKTDFLIGEEAKVHIICNNFSPKKVCSLKVYLKMTEDKYGFAKDKPKTTREIKKLNPQIITVGNVFPLQAGLKWRGDVFYKLTSIGGLEPTKHELQVIDRNYHLVVSCVLKRSKNMHCDIPITLKEMSEEQKLELQQKERERREKEEELNRILLEEEKIKQEEERIKQQEERMKQEQIQKIKEEEEILIRKEQSRIRQEELKRKEEELYERKTQLVHDNLKKHNIDFTVFLELQEMGFVNSLDDYERISNLLIKHRGNINAVTEELIK